jgi:plasmid stabilization system protein ParE
VKPVLVRPAAAADIEEAFLWYERKRPGLGEEFLEIVNAAMGDIAAHPARHPVIYRNTRRLLLRRFPYALYYRVHDDDIIVVACMHGRRSPKRWQQRS